MSLARLIFAPACVADARAARATRGIARAVIARVGVAKYRMDIISSARALACGAASGYDEAYARA